MLNHRHPRISAPKSAMTFLFLLSPLLVSHPVSGQQFDLGDLLGALNGASMQQEDGSCPSLCQDQPSNINNFPVPKRRIRPYSNGCSVPESLRPQLGDYSAFEPCCDLHDACYMSCGIPKAKCEADFKSCMKQQCRIKKTQRQEQQSCSKMADLFVMGTSIFGCGGYVELQQEGCECLPPSLATRRAQEYAQDFYQTYNQTHALPESFTKKYLDNDNDNDNDNDGALKQGKQGEMVYRLYRKYPESIEIISRDGKHGRPHDSFFRPPREDL